MEPASNLTHEVAMLLAQLVALVVALTTLYQTFKNGRSTQDVHKALNGTLDGRIAKEVSRQRQEGQNSPLPGQSPSGVPQTARPTPNRE